MFETIGTLLTIAFWGAGILVFLGGIVLCIGGITSGDGFDRVVSVIGAILGVVVFFFVCSRTESILWPLFASGAVLGLVRVPNPEEKRESSTTKRNGPSFTDAYLEAYTEKKIIEEAVEEAIRKSK